MEPDQSTAKLNAAFGQALQNFGQVLLAILFSFRTFCQVTSLLAGLVGGWLQPICYRDAGERTLRSSALWIVLGLIGWGVVCVFGVAAPTYLLAVLWSVGLWTADWLAALDRRRGAYTFSRFIGFPRLLPAAAASYPLPPLFVAAGGLCLITWKVDTTGGIMLLASAGAVLVQLWTISALRREDAFDLLDSDWLARDRSEASASLAGPGQGRASQGVARAVTTADLVRRFSR